MKKIIVTQRIDYIDSHQEYRDAVDQRLISWLLAAGYWPVVMSNNQQIVEQMVKNNDMDGLLLSGGQSLCHYGGDSSLRDEIEQQLLTWAIENKKPVLGICRGMQLIQDFYHIPLITVQGHVAVKLHLQQVDQQAFKQLFAGCKYVMGYHTLGALTSISPLSTITCSDDGVVMAVKHEELPIYGMMWHPERSQSPKVDIQLLQTIFN